MSISERPTTCPRHPKVETSLRCATCDTLICPNCLVQTPVGAKCRGCASQKGVALFTLSPASAAGAIAAGLLSGAVAGWGVEFGLGLFAIFLAVIYGAFAGEMILRASGRKRGTRMEIIAAVSMTVGALGGRLLIAAMMTSSGGPTAPHGVLSVLLDLFVPTPFPAAAVIIAIASAVSRIRYM